ncbi:FidL-like protein [Providencia sneebia]|uniref:Uncharacterized protein n=1 Tax=Providencia sneebia DSM 19967 TaxID=1141660 RepID=K8WV65_9GAMM|nr:FidL-like protein [Providencia sneebia]EKT60090.1 hypothetical protein OO7_04664 [Providencia sneebia DSM 19967]
MSANVSITIIENKQGIIRMKGFIENSHSQQFVLDRMMNFTMIYKNNDIFTANIKHELKPIIDTVDTDIFEVFMPRDNTLRMLTKLNNNTILFHDVLSPQFICVIF